MKKFIKTIKYTILGISLIAASSGSAALSDDFNTFKTALVSLDNWIVNFLDTQRNKNSLSTCICSLEGDVLVLCGSIQSCVTPAERQLFLLTQDLQANILKMHDALTSGPILKIIGTLKNAFATNSSLHTMLANAQKQFDKLITLAEKEDPTLAQEMKAFNVSTLQPLQAKWTHYQTSDFLAKARVRSKF